MTCQARRQSDEMYCARCRLRWDVNDSDPPHCARLPVVASPPLAPERETGPALRIGNERLPFVSGLPARLGPSS